MDRCLEKARGVGTILENVHSDEGLLCPSLLKYDKYDKTAYTNDQGNLKPDTLVKFIADQTPLKGAQDSG